MNHDTELGRTDSAPIPVPSGISLTEQEFLDQLGRDLSNIQPPQLKPGMTWGTFPEQHVVVCINRTRGRMNECNSRAQVLDILIEELITTQGGNFNGEEFRRLSGSSKAKPN